MKQVMILLRSTKKLRMLKYKEHVVIMANVYWQMFIGKD